MLKYKPFFLLTMKNGNGRVDVREIMPGNEGYPNGTRHRAPTQEMGKVKDMWILMTVSWTRTRTKMRQRHHRRRIQ